MHTGRRWLTTPLHGECRRLIDVRRNKIHQSIAMNARQLPQSKCHMNGCASTGPRTAEGLARSRRARWKHGPHSAEALTEQKRVRELLAQSRELLKQMQTTRGTAGRLKGPVVMGPIPQPVGIGMAAGAGCGEITYCNLFYWCGYFPVAPVPMVSGTSSVPIRPERRSKTASLS